MSNLLDRLRTEFAAAWKPEPGDEIEGVIAALDEREGKYGGYPIVTIAPDDGEELAVHAYHDVLSRELARWRPKVGERIAIRYDGRKGSDGYHLYRVVLDRPTDKGFDWEKFGEDAKAPNAEAPDTNGFEPGDDKPIPF